ncbi:helix-turn-helix domain containing protein [Sulfitobacter porphyrae]|nr:helix-turn-helix domain containing protein [Sulfitobacter porphyrae]
MRELARSAGCHASTIMRQIRRIETRRDDPLVDAALQRLGAERRPTGAGKNALKEELPMAQPAHKSVPDEAALTQEAMRILPRLCETGAVLAIAADMEKAVVVRDTASGGSTRTAVVDAAVAQAMALKDWIAPSNSGRIIRYHITTAGRSALGGMIGAEGGMPRGTQGFAEAQTGFDGADAGWRDDTGEAACSHRQKMRYSLAESPLIALSRRKDKSGKPFLSDALVHAGERLREDFELAQMGTRVTQNWQGFLTAGTQGGTCGTRAMPDSAGAAQARVTAALRYLGPGLSDVALRCCCYLEGLETTEKRLGWSARSGKIVLRIALMRLKRHYDETIGPGGPMIG